MSFRETVWQSRNKYWKKNVKICCFYSTIERKENERKKRHQINGMGAIWLWLWTNQHYAMKRRAAVHWVAMFQSHLVFLYGKVILFKVVLPKKSA